MMTRDPVLQLLAIVSDPVAARARLEEFALRRAEINVVLAEAEGRIAEARTMERQLAERERQVTARESNVRRREAALAKGV
jgi:uncharacterized protein (DUF3084 family)